MKRINDLQMSWLFLDDHIYWVQYIQVNTLTPNFLTNFKKRYIFREIISFKLGR